jgi:hypothetical protein
MNAIGGLGAVGFTVTEVEAAVVIPRHGYP